MKSVLSLSLLAVIVCCGCAASAPQSTFTASSVSEIKSGMTKAQVTGLLGEPRSRSIDNGHNEVWQYRKNAQEGKGMKTYENIASMGLLAGHDAEYQDILTVTFKNDVVTGSAYEENVQSPTPLMRR